MLIISIYSPHSCKAYLNTSHVNVNPFVDAGDILLSKYLNTSHVNVNHLA